MVSPQKKFKMPIHIDKLQYATLCLFRLLQIMMSGSEASYRDRIYIVKDVILKLIEYGELNQTTLVSFCRLNLKKHKSILDDLELDNFNSEHMMHYMHETMISKVFN
jgi:predicted transcriptional regulator